MASDAAVPGIDIRQISAEVFQDIKPWCVELSQLALLPNSAFRPDSPKLISTIARLSEVLAAAKSSYAQSHKLFIISPNLADYVFFPLSNLLQKPSLDDKVVQHVLHIIAFLITNAWIPNGKFEPALIDQLYPVIIYLIKKDNVDLLKTKPFAFRVASYTVLNQLLRGIDRSYFSGNDAKRLSILGDTTSIVLALLVDLNRPSPEEIDFTNELLQLMLFVFCQLITVDQLSHIFPGIVSHLVNVCVKSRNLNFLVLVSIIKLLTGIITLVFDDETLGVTSVVEEKSLEALGEQWNKDQSVDAQDFTLSLNSTKDRNTSWLRAMSKQLKISISILFNDVLLSSANASKIRSKPVLVDAILRFVKDVNHHCFWSLFTELFALNMDILSLVVAIKVFNDHEPLKNEEQTALMASTVSAAKADGIPNDYIKRQDIVVSAVTKKLDNLVNNKLSSVLLSSSDEKINNILVAIKFHLVYLAQIPGTEEELKTLRSSVVKQTKSALSNTISLLSQQSNTIEAAAPKQDIQDGKNASNKLDNIELPSYINASSVTAIRNDKAVHKTSKTHTTQLQLLAKEWSLDQPANPTETQIFSSTFSPTVEENIGSLLEFVSQAEHSGDQKLSVLEDIFEDETVHNSELNNEIVLWMANNYFASIPSSSKDVIDEFFVSEKLDQVSLDDDQLEEMSYLILTKAQDVLESVGPDLDNATISTKKDQKWQQLVRTGSYSVALDSFGLLSDHLKKEEFQEAVLLNNLYSMLEALTFTFNPMVQEHAKNAIARIAGNYYNNSVTDLIIDNSNYLIDSLSLVLSVPGSLTPAVSGILLIVLKISGTKLLQDNQLNDVLKQMFILIDSYHGYSILVEGFFVVFRELVSQIDAQYISDQRTILGGENLYKPWGLRSKEAMLQLINDSGKVVEPFKDYDADKEYFTRPRDAPFSEMDSDDEEEEEKQDESEVWNSKVPKSTYMLVQKIFLYGMKLLSGPSNSLQVQILKTIQIVNPILSTNYPLFLPLLSRHWHVLLSLLENTEDTIAIETLSTMTQILAIDREKGETFMSSKFLESWDKLSENPLTKLVKKAGSKDVVKSVRSKHDPKLFELLVKFLVQGLQNYERIVPDITSVHILQFTAAVGDLSKHELSLGMRSALWVLNKW